MDKNYQYNFSIKYELMFDNSIRRSKANKTLSVLKDYLILLYQRIFGY